MFKPHSFWLSLYSFEMPCNYHAEATITIEETTFVVIVCRLLRRHRFSSLPFLQCSPVTNAPRIDHFATRLCLPPTLQFLVFDSDFVVTRFFFLKSSMWRYRWHAKSSAGFQGLLWAFLLFHAITPVCFEPDACFSQINDFKFQIYSGKYKAVVKVQGIGVNLQEEVPRFSNRRRDILCYLSWR